MRKAIIALAAIAVHCGAAAGDYSDAVAKQSRCESAGKLAQSVHGANINLRARGDELDAKVRARKITRQLAEETKYILFLGQQASSPRDAYMQAWGFCMDRRDKK